MRRDGGAATVSVVAVAIVETFTDEALSICLSAFQGSKEERRFVFVVHWRRR